MGTPKLASGLTNKDLVGQAFWIPAHSTALRAGTARGGNEKNNPHLAGWGLNNFEIATSVRRAGLLAMTMSCCMVRIARRL